MKPWVKTALTLGAVSVALGLGYTIYYFGYAKRKKDKQGGQNTPPSGSNSNTNPAQEKIDLGLKGRGSLLENEADLSGYVRPGKQPTFTGNPRQGATLTSGSEGRAGAAKITV